MNRLTITDPERLASRKRVAAMHPADRFKAMFGLTSGPIQDYEITETNEAAERTRKRCNNLTNEERAELLEFAMQTINGSTTLNPPASQPTSCPPDPGK